MDLNKAINKAKIRHLKKTAPLGSLISHAFQCLKMIKLIYLEVGLKSHFSIWFTFISGTQYPCIMFTFILKLNAEI